MKKMNNKGFSLVELIIVIAIMAILAGAIAPALIRYIDKSRKSNDVTSCKAIKTAVETALGNETIYEYLTATGSDNYSIVKVVPGQTTSASGEGTAAVKISGIEGYTGDCTAAIAAKEIGTNIGEKAPKIKFKKTSTIGSGTSDGPVPKNFYAFISNKGTVYVVIGGDDIPGFTAATGTVTNGYIICPEICPSYQ